MIIKWVRSYRPGVYIRRQVIYKGDWVSVYGFLLWRTKRRSRKWAGPAAIVPAKAPQPIPTQYERHDDKSSSPYEVNYTPMGNNHPEGKNDRYSFTI